MRKAELDQKIQKIQHTDPNLYEILRLLNLDIEEIDTRTKPVVEAFYAVEPVVLDVPEDLILARYEFLPTFLKLYWNREPTARFYEVRLGSDWDTAELVTITTNVEVYLNPIAAGTHTYLVKSQSSGGTYSANALSIEVIVPIIPAPIVTGQVVDNNVLLYWTEPISVFEISYYNVYRDGNYIGYVDGTFHTIFESISDTFTYTVEAVDVGGNEGAQGSISLEVDQPPDYFLDDEQESTFTGTKTNCLSVDGYLYATFDPTRTYQQHFDDMTFDQWSDFIANGYDYFLQQNETTGSYVEVIDYGTTINDVIWSAGWTTEELAPSITVTTTIEYSTDGSTWSAPISGSAAFISSFRYIRWTMNFASVDDDALIRISDLMYRLELKHEMDSGEIAALSTDAGGTTVTFNKAFRDVDSLTASAKSTTEAKVIIDFTDAPNPTTFKVLVFDAAGARVSKTVYWKARGTT